MSNRTNRPRPTRILLHRIVRVVGGADAAILTGFLACGLIAVVAITTQQ